jgi:hypothetical protein
MLLQERTSLYDEELNKIDEVIRKDKELLNQYLKSNEEKEKAGAARSTAEIKRLQDEISANRKKEQSIREQRRKSAARAKAAAIAEVIFNTALAVTTELKKGLPLGLITGGIAAAAGAAQLAVVTSQEFAEGTEFVDDPNAPNGVDTVPVWLTKGERVVSVKDSSKIPKNFPNYLLGDAVNHYLSSDFIQSDREISELQQQTGYLKKMAQDNEVKYDVHGRKTYERIGNTINIYS